MGHFLLSFFMSLMLPTILRWDYKGWNQVRKWRFVDRRSHRADSGYGCKTPYQYNVLWSRMLRQRRERSQGTGAAGTGRLDTLAYSEANSSLSGYCSINSRNNFRARAA